jgi:FkbM family methyltransferase
MKNQLSFRLATLLFDNFFPLYKILYAQFKNRQDKVEIDWIKKNVRQGQTVLDIGANIGFYTQILAQQVGEKGKVYAFEPEKLNFVRLQKAVSELPQVQIEQKAVADSNGKLPIYVSHRLNVDNRTYKPEEYKSVYEIDKVSIDLFLPNQKIDFIKIDIQGFELQAFKGMEKTLANNPNIQIVSELWDHGLRTAGSSASELMNYLNQLGFQVYSLDSPTLEIMKPESVESEEDKYYNILIKRNLN